MWAVLTLIQLFSKLDFQALMNAGKWMNTGTFRSFYLRDLCNQVNIQVTKWTCGSWWKITSTWLWTFFVFSSCFNPFSSQSIPISLCWGMAGIRTLPVLHHWLPLSLVFLALCLRCRISQSSHPANLFLTIILNVIWDTCTCIICIKQNWTFWIESNFSKDNRISP